MVARRHFSLISLVMLVLLLPVLTLSSWYLATRHTKHSIDTVSHTAYMRLLSHIEDSARLLLPINSSASRLAKVLSASLNGNLLSFNTLQNQVAHDMFISYSAIPHISQISYMGEDGLFFSYYEEENKTLALFANVSYSSSGSTGNGSSVYCWYSQLVNDNTGERYGEPMALAPLTFWNTSWFYNTLNSTNGYVSWGLGWGKSQDPLFLFMAPIKDFLPRGQRGIISLGVTVKVFMNFISSIDLHGGDIYLTTEDGHLLAQSGTLYIGGMFDNDMDLVETSSSDNKSMGRPDSYLGCDMNNYSSRGSQVVSDVNVNIQGERFMLCCAPLELEGVRLVSVIALPHKQFLNLIPRSNKVERILSLLMLICVVLLSFFIAILIYRFVTREVYLCATLIKQVEATQQAERKSMNKSIAFASASHDVRTSLAAIIGLIDLCLVDVSKGLELESNLVQMNACASNLLGILNSVLDTSKIEAGKMQLEEVEFDLSQVLEEVVDMFYIVALKKGIEMVLDPCDGSIMESFIVKGDCGRLKQIICNLLSNAIKFTSEGHVLIRAWIKKPTPESSVLSSNHGSFLYNIWRSLSWRVCKDDNAYRDLGSIHMVSQIPNSIEFLCEVDDTGKGIPKDKHKFVFENFVQIKEPFSGGSNGTGLGLGIVQSLVRLMGGEISIANKEPGEKGTCFRFNTFLKTGKSEVFAEDSDQVQNQLHQTHASGSIAPKLGLNIQGNSSSRSEKFKNFKLEGILALFMINGEAERKTSKKWMEMHGIEVWALNQWESLYPTLEKINREMFANYFGTSGSFRSDSFESYSSTSRFYNVNVAEQEISPSANDGVDHLLTSNISAATYILIVIDMSCGPFLEMCSILAKFVKTIPDGQCKVVWLANVESPSVDLETLKSKKVPCDIILQKPFHGSRLYAVLRLLQEFQGKNETHTHETRSEFLSQDIQHSTGNFASTSGNTQSSHHTQRIQIEGNLIGDVPLRSMNILVVEDNAVLRRLAMATVSRLGATAECCENGEQALKLVCDALHRINDADKEIYIHRERPRVCKKFPYDIVLMDCEMPVMDGYEATRQIRSEEKRYGLRIPIIALTAHAMADEAIKFIQAGMDFHLMKPLNADSLLDAIHNIHHR